MQSGTIRGGDIFRVLDDYGRKRKPVFFAIDFGKTEAIVLPPGEAASAGVFFEIGGRSNYRRHPARSAEITFVKRPVSFG